MRTYSILIAFFLVVLFGVVTGQIRIDHKGHPHGRVHGKTQEPKELIDTVRMSSGVGYLVLQKAFTENQHTTKPIEFLYATVTPILVDTAQDINSYATYLSTNQDTLIVKSSSAVDSLLVTVRAFVK